MAWLIRWGNERSGHGFSHPTGMIAWGIVLLLLVVPSVAMAQGESESFLPNNVVDMVIAPELFDRAAVAYDEQDFRRAELDLSLFILLNPTFSLGYHFRAQTLISEGELDRAMDDLDQAIATSSNLNSAYVSELLTDRANLLTQNSRFSDALADYTQAISLAPSTRALVGRGRLYMQQNDLELARGDFDVAIGQDRSNPFLYAYRAQVIAQMDEPRAAAADYLEYINGIEITSANERVPASGALVSIQMGFGATHRLRFEASAGQRLNAVASRRSPTVDPLLVVLDEDGEPLIADDDSGGGGSAAIEGFTIPADGTYTLVVGHSLGGSEGEIVVGIELVGEK